MLNFYQIYIFYMAKSISESGNYQGAANLVKAPPEINQSLKRFSTMYQQRQADDNNNLIKYRDNNNRCLICQQFFVSSQLQFLATCTHSFCLECLHNYVLYKITVGQEIECPQSDCQEIITKQENCYERIPQRYKNRYQNFKLANQTLSNSKQLPCQALNCKGVIDSVQLKCDTCKFQICQKCHLKKHLGGCNKSYYLNFLQWRVCSECHEFSEIDANKSDNKIKCKCGHEYCSVCRQNWSQAHFMCNEHADTSVQDQVFCRAAVMKSNRCLNFIRSLLLVISIPFIIIIIFLSIILTLLAVTVFALLFSPCLSFIQLESYPKAIICFPCVGLYKTGQFIKRYVGTVCSIGCDFMGRLAMTIKALCCYSKKDVEVQSNKIQYVN